MIHISGQVLSVRDTIGVCWSTGRCRGEL